MFKKKSYSTIDASLSGQYKKFFQSKTESLRQFLLESPTQYSDVFRIFDLTRLQMKFPKKSQMIGMALMSWYMPEEIKFLVQLELREAWDRQSREIRDVLLTSKDFAISWLICESEWTESDFFGNVLNKRLSELWNFSEFKRISRKKIPKYSGYCRGYQESNRGAPRSLSSEHFASRSVEEQLEEEAFFLKQKKILFQRIKEDLNLLLLLEEIEELKFQDY